MVIKIPNTFFGKPIAGAMNLVLTSPATPKPAKKDTKAPTPANINGPENYIILEGKTHESYSYPDMLVSKERSYLNKNWNQTQDAVKKEDGYMLTIRQFANFLSLLKTGKAYDGTGKKVDSKELERLFLDITEIKDPWRAEWLDAKFGNRTITYHLINSNGNVTETTEDLDCLRENRDPGLSLDSWLNTADYHGLPNYKTKKGKMYYWAPTDGRVARFFAISVWAFLYCNWFPTSSDPALGVRVVRKKI